jgi:hypothetical protein
MGMREMPKLKKNSTKPGQFKVEVLTKENYQQKHIFIQIQ